MTRCDEVRCSVVSEPNFKNYYFIMVYTITMNYIYCDRRFSPYHPPVTVSPPIHLKRKCDMRCSTMLVVTKSCTSSKALLRYNFAK